MFKGALKTAGLPHIRIHELRHTAASIAVASGANVNAVQRMLGHSSAQMTLDVYAGLFDTDLDTLADNLNLAYLRVDADSVLTEPEEQQVPDLQLTAEKPNVIRAFLGAASENRTRDLRITSASLWPTELRRRGRRTAQLDDSNRAGRQPPPRR